MNLVISENIKWITECPEKWSFFRNKSYKAQVQTADPERIYNVPDQKGVVYNFFEDAYEKVSNTGFVVTGAAGEMWPIGEKALKKYNLKPEDVTDEPLSVMTVETPDVYAGIMIPKDTQFTLEVDYGEKCVLKGNRTDIGHADGDWVLVAAKLENGVYVPDFDDSGRVVNGTIFETLYQPL